MDSYGSISGMRPNPKSDIGVLVFVFVFGGSCRGPFTAYVGMQSHDRWGGMIINRIDREYVITPPQLGKC